MKKVIKIVVDGDAYITVPEIDPRSCEGCVFFVNDGCSNHTIDPDMCLPNGSIFAHEQPSKQKSSLEEFDKIATEFLDTQDDIDCGVNGFTYRDDAKCIIDKLRKFLFPIDIEKEKRKP